ncbi:MAG: DUF805 domain-containing protein [Flavobacteriales bacterium]|nr:DUF805 domain-containing protein [Flavobacteriales bacterium]
MNWYIKVLRNYTNFEGRARRQEFWMFFLINLIISAILQVIDFTFYGIENDLNPISTIYSLAVLLPNIGVCIRRMHDINKSGWYMLIPVYNIFLFATEGDSGENQYGSDPKEEESSNELLDR